MAATTPRRSLRSFHTHTPKMSERKKSLFTADSETSRESLTKHRRLPVVDSETDSDDFDLGIIGTLDSSSCDENEQNYVKSLEKMIPWHETRSQTKKLKENNNLKNFMKSPFTLKKYQTRYSLPDSKCTGSSSTPVTPHFQHHPVTPSSSHSCTSVHTTSSTSSKARKSLASLIADTESCSSSLKDLNFDDIDSSSDSKENTPTKFPRRSLRRHKLTPKLQSFKGVLVEQKKNVSPMKTAFVCLTKMDLNSISPLASVLSPTQMMKTPHNISENKTTPPKLGHNRRSIVELEESPESNCETEKSQKRLHYDGMTDNGPALKHPRLGSNSAPKAKLSLFSSDRLREILSAKSFYGKSNPDLTPNVSTKLYNAIEATTTQINKRFTHSRSHRRRRKPGEINMGVRHRIRKPKIQNKAKMILPKNSQYGSAYNLNISSTSNTLNNKEESLNQSSVLIQDEKADPFDKEKQTIEALLSQWTEEEVPESEMSFSKPQTELPCFSSTVIEETNQIFQPVTAVPVPPESYKPSESEVILELGKSGTESSGQNMDVTMLDGDCHKANHGGVPENGDYLPVEGGYLVVGNDAPGQSEIPDLDEIEREIKMLDKQILQMAQSNNINAEVVLASTETTITSNTEESIIQKQETPQRMFSIFNKPNPGLSSPSSKSTIDKSKKLLKNGSDQYVIDAGQKKFGATQCNECGVIYQIGDPQDEHDHLVHHNAVDVLRFNGWKEECIVGRHGDERCLRVRGGDSGWKKVCTLLRDVVHPQLGYGADLPRPPHEYTAYLYIEKKKIVGCLIMEPKRRAYKMMPGDPDCCSIEDYPVNCGISRIWTHASHRRRGIASFMLDCARASFLHGIAMAKSDIAFSAPTPAGKTLATNYTGTPNFFVYLD